MRDSGLSDFARYRPVPAALALASVLLPAIAAGQSGFGALAAGEREVTTAGLPLARAWRVSAPPEIDGDVLNDPAWADATPATGFRQNTPDEGAPASERTEVYVVYTGDTLYFGVVCYVRDPGTIIVADSRRDSSLRETDSFQIILDTFHDRQNGFVFGTNPAGVEYDGQVTNEGQGSGRSGGFVVRSGSGQQRGSGGGFNLNWDGVWEVDAQVSDIGWTAEIAIPFRTLRYPSGEAQVWGVNFQRNIRSRNEQSYWAPLPRQFDLNRLSLAGELQGIAVPQQRNLKLTPFAVGSWRGGRETERPDFGADLKYSVTPGLTLDATYNTDFAQVEVDDQQINLDRFNLFFPEKRPFFLENAGLFSVGQPGQLEIFFSRRIGIVDGAQIPILGGGRLSGKVGNNTNVGFLNMQTEAAAGARANNFTVARVRQDFVNRSNVGVMLVNRSGTGPGGGGDHNRSYAADGRLGIGQEVTLSGFAAATETPGAASETHAYSGQASYDSERYRFGAGFTEVAPHFNPEVGFYARRGYRRTDARFRTAFRPRNSWGFHEFTPHLTHYTILDYTTGQYETQYTHLDSTVEWRNGSRLATAWNVTKEGVLQPFEIYPGIDVPIDTYSHSEGQFRFNTNRGAPVSFEFRAVTGGFFGGRRLRVGPEVSVRAGETFNAQLAWDRNDITLPNGPFVTNLVRTRVNYSFTTRMFVQALVQYNDRDQLWSSNVRFGLLSAANTGLFVVYNDIRFFDHYDLFDRHLAHTAVRGVPSPSSTARCSTSCSRRRPAGRASAGRTGGERAGPVTFTMTREFQFRPSRVAVIAVLLAFAAGAEAEQAGAQRPATDALGAREMTVTGAPLTRPARVVEGPEIDGEVLGDPVYAAAVPATGFVQSRPFEGQPASERTEVRIVHTDDTLYFGIVCYTADPATIIAADSRRDSDLTETDSFQIILDTYHDGLNGFVFGTNPAGVEYDGQVTNEGQGTGRFGGGGSGRPSNSMQQRGSGGGLNINWDGAWQVSTRVSDVGWSAEIAIPFRTLRYPTADVQTWGMNFQRNIRARNEQAYWSPLPRQFNLNRLSLAGELRGLRVPPQRNLQFIPYSLGSATRRTADGTTAGDGNVGADLKYSLTPSLTLDGTFRTDFAQVEVDDEQINLDRFTLFFPEKRPFFLENAGLFSVGQSGAVDVFFSRRIGLGDRGEQIPIIGGGRLSGKIGTDTNVGFLNMQTAEVGGSEAAPGTASQNFTVGRVRHDLPNRTNIGAMFVNRQASGNLAGDRDYNRTYALDGRWGIGQGGTVSGFAAATETPGVSGGNVHAYALSAQHQSEVARLSLGYTEVAPNFNPEVGFLARRSYRRMNGSVFTTLRPDDFWGVHEFRPHINHFTIFDFETGWQETQFTHIDNHIEWRNGYEVHTGVNITREGVFEPFEIFPGVWVPPDRYDHSEAQLAANTNLGAPVSGNVNVIVGGLFGGSRVTVTPSVAARVGETLNAMLEWSYNDLDLPSGHFTTNLARLRVSYSFSTRMFLQALVQYNDRADLWSSNLRFGLLSDANTGLFIVYNDIQWLDLRREMPLGLGRTLTVKYSYLFDLLR